MWYILSDTKEEDSSSSRREEKCLMAAENSNELPLIYKHLPSAYNVPGIMLGAGDTTRNRTGFLVPRGL